MKQPNVLVVADQGEFAQALMGRWHSERVVPAFTVMNSEVFNGHACRSSDMVIVGDVNAKQFPSVLAAVSDAGKSAIVVAPDAVHAHNANGRGAHIMVLRQHEGWVDLLILLASECLRRIELNERLQRVEDAMSELSAQATLGRYMLDMRHSFNNALTSVLGNAELLLMEPGQFSGEVRDQLTTIRSMSLRLNEIVARFSSLEAELSFAKRETQGEVIPFVRSNAAGFSSF